jgi:DNA-binding transcriptional ArsR family regulator
MAAEPAFKPAEREAPVCEDNFVHFEAVSRLRPLMGQFEGLAEVFKALGDENRLKVIYALSQTELCVCDVAAVLGASKATASYHLRLLHHLGLAKYRKEGKLVFYRLADPHLGHMVEEVLRHKESKRIAPAAGALAFGEGLDDGSATN